MASNTFLSLSPKAKYFLETLISCEDIKQVVFDLGKPKVSGPKGVQAGFFQLYWDVVGMDVIDVILEFFYNNTSIECIN